MMRKAIALIPSSLGMVSLTVAGRLHEFFVFRLRPRIFFSSATMPSFGCPITSEPGTRAFSGLNW